MYPMRQKTIIQRNDIEGEDVIGNNPVLQIFLGMHHNTLLGQ